MSVFFFLWISGLVWNWIKCVFICFVFQFSNLTFACNGFHLKSWNKSSIWFLNWRAEEHLAVSKKTVERLCLGTVGLIVAPWKFDILKTSVFALEASLLEQIFMPHYFYKACPPLARCVGWAPFAGELMTWHTLAYFGHRSSRLSLVTYLTKTNSVLLCTTCSQQRWGDTLTSATIVS